MLQFINKYNQVKDVRDDVLMWGDEIEYSIVSFDRANRVPRLKLNGAEVRSAPLLLELTTRRQRKGGLEKFLVYLAPVSLRA